MKLFLLFLVAVTSAAILGIDLGQQFTKAVLLAPGILFELVLTDEGKRKDLSGLSIRPHPDAKDELERVYGSATGSLCTRFPQSCALHLKSLLGKSNNDILKIEYTKLHFVKVFGDDTRNDSIKIDVGIDNEDFTVEELVAMSLNNIRQRAIMDLEELSHSKMSIIDVAVSIPPFASQGVRQAYLDTLSLANFTSVLGLIDEGTAVALNFVSNKKKDDVKILDKKEYNLVYDMGAGSTKATLFSTVTFKNGSVHLELENIGYDESFGGQLLTNSIATIIKAKFLTKFSLEESDITDKVMARILEAAEKAKIVLSVNTDYYVSLESLYKEKDFKATITKDEFEEINIDLAKRITNPIFDAIKNTGVSIDQLKNVVLSGGSIRVPFVQKGLLSILSEEQISKNVNADESCAVGTTARAFKLKTQFEKAKDIKVIDKVYHNYELTVNGVEEPIVIFPRGSQIGNTTNINLTKLQGKASESSSDNVDVGLYEDGKLIKSYEFDNIVKKGEKLKCKNKKDLRQLIGTFSLNNNKIFDLVNVEIACVESEKKKSGGFMKNFLKKEVEEVEEVEEDDEEVVADNETSETSNSTDSTNSTTTKKAPVKRTPIQPRPIKVSLPKANYTHIKPMSSSTKDRIFRKLSLWNSLDESRFQLDAVKNILEGQCYEFRNFLEDNEELLERETAGLSDYSDFVGDVIEWLEFESDGSSIDHFHGKIKDINTKKKELDGIIKMSKTDLSLDGLTKLYEEGSQIVMSIQGYLIEFGTEISALRQKFEEHEFDFDKENDKLKLQLLNKNGGMDKMLSLDQNLAEYKEELTRLGDIVDLNPKNFNKLSKADIWEVYEVISTKIIEMLSDVALVEQSHKDRIDLFESKLKKLQERKLQKEFREKLREEAKKKKKEEENVTEEEEYEEEGQEEVAVEVDENDNEEEDPKTQEEIEVEEGDVEEAEKGKEKEEEENVHDEL